MRARLSIPPGLLRLAELQSGVLSRGQITGFGLSPTVIARLVADQHWGRLTTGIYLVPDSEPTWLGRVWAGVLLGGSEARVGSAAAANLQGLVDEPGLPIEILVPFGTRLKNRDWVVFRQERPGVRSISTRTEPPCTRIEDTVLDLCAIGTQSDCIDLITAAVQRRSTTPKSLARALLRRTRMPHRKFVQALIAETASGVHSPLEHRFRRDVELAHGLPKGRRQKPGSGEFLDVYYDAFDVIIELDGHLGHVGRGRFRDRRRDNRHAQSGAKTLRYGWEEVNRDCCGVAAELAETLINRGWNGYPTKCPRCLG